VESDLTLGQDNAALFWDATNDRLGIGTNVPAATLSVTQPALAATNAPAMKLIAGAHTALAAGTEAQDVYYDLSRTVQFATGAIATQRAFYIDAPTYAFVGASVITDAATLAIGGDPSAGPNATITRGYGLWNYGNTYLAGSQRVGRTGVSTATYTILLTDYIIGVTRTSAGACAITLPSAIVAGAGRVYIIKDEAGLSGTNPITVTATAGNIDGVASFTIDGNYNAFSFYSDGTNWFMI
jgi:hypothetical protein